jgi:hypothetical protein
MKSKSAFTKIDLVIVLICVVFLFANIAAVGQGGRKRAQAAVCLSNLHKWGQIFNAYTADNDGFFHSRQLGTIPGYASMWQYVYKPYYDDKMMRFCPTADNVTNMTGCFGTWNYGIGQYHPLLDPALHMPGESEFDPATGQVQEGYFTGSYGMNRYVENMQGGTTETSPAFWRRADVKGGDKAPVLLDCQYIYYLASSIDDPPAYNGDFTGNEMKWICIDRHDGFINSVFLDFSARKVGLKELWVLKHSRTYDTCDPWTICGFGGDEEACAAAWDAAAPWMRDFPEY